MSTTPNDTGRTAWQRWKDFWFAPKDPTLLGFMRIVTGLLVLYIHLAYSLDLQAFFGKHGWYADRYVNRERHETPAYVSPFWSWDEPYISPRLSDFPHRRQAFMEFLRGLPGPKAQRNEALAYLNRADQFPNPDDFRRAMVYVQQMSTRAELGNSVAVIQGGQVRDQATTETYEWAVPEFVKGKDEAERYRTGELEPEPRLVVTTSGALGGWAQPGGPFSAAPVPGPIEDTYGAGDCFAAGLAFALAAGLDSVDALGFAARCGAGALTGPGVHAETVPL